MTTEQFTKEEFYIKSKSLGYFIGECLGLGFFESHITDGTLSPREQPAVFNSREEAQNYLDSWQGGQVDCFVTNEKPIGVSNAN